jgi:lysophospholipase L1-like esterase
MSIYLIGDGILDNFRYLNDKSLDLRKELSDMGYDVHNYAKEEVKVIDVLNGYKLNNKQINSRDYKYNVDSKDNTLYPLVLLRKHTNTYNMGGNNIAVISVGGNDVGERFFNIMLGVEYFINAVLTEQFKNNYEKIIDSVHTDCPKMILVSMYLPYLGQNSYYGKYVNYSVPIMEKWNEFIYSLAKKHNIPVLDLNKTINTSNRDHYGTNDSRLSNIATKCIAKCIKYIYTHYEGHYIYYSPDCNCKKIHKSRP